MWNKVENDTGSWNRLKANDSPTTIMGSHCMQLCCAQVHTYPLTLRFFCIVTSHCHKMHDVHFSKFWNCCRFSVFLGDLMWHIVLYWACLSCLASFILTEIQLWSAKLMVILSAGVVITLNSLKHTTLLLSSVGFNSPSYIVCVVILLCVLGRIRVVMFIVCIFCLVMSKYICFHSSKWTPT